MAISSPLSSERRGFPVTREWAIQHTTIMATKRTIKRKATKKSASARKTTKKTAKKVTKKTAKKAAANASRGKRYTQAEKNKVVAFVNQVNAEKGRGGVAAASREFGVTQLTIANWVKKGGAPAAQAAPAGRKMAAKKASKKAGRKASSGRSALHELVALDDEIAALEAELAAKKDRFEQLKAKI